METIETLIKIDKNSVLGTVTNEALYTAHARLAGNAAAKALVPSRDDWDMLTVYYDMALADLRVALSRYTKDSGEASDTVDGITSITLAMPDTWDAKGADAAQQHAKRYIVLRVMELWNGVADMGAANAYREMMHALHRRKEILRVGINPLF